jgi:hypothetical protein
VSDDGFRVSERIVPRTGSLSRWDRVLLLVATGLFAVAALIVGVSSVAGALRAFSPVPYWDMWGGYLRSMLAIDDGSVSEWWAQHNEHRLLVARMFFWVDIHVFGGTSPFLIISILAVVIAIVVVLIVALAHRLRESRNTLAPPYGFLILSSIITIGMMSWMQNENLIWGFQIQFVLATLCPLATLVFLALASESSLTRPRASLVFFVAALVSAVGAVGSMSSGIVAPWIALAYVLVMRFRRWQMALTAVVAVALTAAYLIGYVRPSEHGDPLHELISNPIGFLSYLAVYLGGPFYWATKSLWMAGIAGIVIAVAVVALTITLLRSRRSHAMGLALIAFAWSVIGVGILTASGRLVFGIEQATASRYQTPTLALWLAVLVVCSVGLQARLSERPWLPIIALGVIVVTLIPAQKPAFGDFGPRQAERNLAAVAVALGINDPQALGTVYPDPQFALTEGKLAMTKHFGLFGQQPWASMSATLGTPSRATKTVACHGTIDSASVLANTQIERIDGWAVETPHAFSPGDVLEVVDRTNLIIGYAVIGSSRPDVAQAYPASTADSGLSGYVPTGTDLTTTHLAKGDVACDSGLTPAPLPTK